MRHLRSTGVMSASVAKTTDQDPILLAAFRQWMRQQRGTCDPTLNRYSLPIRELLIHLGEDPSKFDAQSLRQFVLEKGRRSGWASAKMCTTALRMFLRFLIAEGKCADDLDTAIPVLAHWRLSSLPRYLQPEEVERIISSCDSSSPVGRRDRAILCPRPPGTSGGRYRPASLGRYKLGRSQYSGVWKRTSSDSAASDPGGWPCGSGLPARRPSSNLHRCTVCPLSRAFSRLLTQFRHIVHRYSGDAPSGRLLPKQGCGPPSSAFRGNLHVAARSIAAGHCGRPSAPLNRDYANLRKSRRDRSTTDFSTLAGGAAMLAQAVESYLAVRRACGFEFKPQSTFLRSFATFSNAKGKRHVCSEIAIEWAGLARSVHQRAARLGHVIRFARHVRAEDQSHELPPAVFGSERQSRPTPYIFLRTTSTVSCKRHLSPVPVVCVNIPTARYSLCWHARDCVCPKHSGCALRTSPQMVW